MIDKHYLKNSTTFFAIYIILYVPEVLDNFVCHIGVTSAKQFMDMALM